MMKKFSIEMLPAKQGDCLWIEYGEAENPNRILIDGGTSQTYQEITKKIKQLKTQKIHFDLLIVSHIDLDHIQGIIKLLKDQKITLSLGQIWFNAYRHLPGTIETFGPVEGEILSTILDQKQISWNPKFQEGRIMINQEADLPTISLDGEMKLTLLSPYPQQLKALKEVWKEECQKAGIDPSRPKPKVVREEIEGIESFGPLNIETLAAKEFEKDKSVPNGSSIAIIAEYDSKKVLLAGDAYPENLLQSITKIEKNPNKKLKLDAFKIPHHGSKHNINQQLLQKIECNRYLISTDGTLYKHPDREAIAKIIKYSTPNPELIFNYNNEYTQIWDDARQKQKYSYTTTYPSVSEKGKIINL
jgi:beta-lactamase superfamily II metal-dependent hydrolase